MKQVRKSVFETNSSSTHSISIDTKPEFDQMLVPDENGEIHTYYGEYGWEEEVHYDAETKLSYAVTWIAGIAPESQPHLEQKAMLVKVVNDHTGGTLIFPHAEKTEWGLDAGYIDHQSAFHEGGALGEAFESPESLKALLFKSGSYVETDNDNH